MTKTNQANAVILTVSLGLFSALLYFLLYLFAEPILNWSDGWSVIVLIIIAFIFSLVHGAFVNHFWDILDVKPNIAKKDSGVNLNGNFH